MHAYRCIECTLFRCDALGDVCGECQHSIVTPEVKDEAKARIEAGPWRSHTLVYTMPGSTPRSPAVPLAPPPAAGTTTKVLLVAGDHKGNARAAALALMSISWGELINFVNTHRPGSKITGLAISELHTILTGYGNAP